MKQVIRHNAFETNSSSTHSICVCGNDSHIIEGGFKEHNNELVELYSGQFGWNQDTFSDFASKLDYLYMYIDLTKDGYAPRNKHTKDKESFIQWLFEEFAKRNCTLLTEDVSIKKEYYGYIDHQSIPDDDLEEVLRSKKSILNFLFNPSCTITTDNDNH